MQENKYDHIIHRSSAAWPTNHASDNEVSKQEIVLVQIDLVPLDPLTFCAHVACKEFWESTTMTDFEFS
jgi:hypothetical protein